jgi:hypothetical protein
MKLAEALILRADCQKRIAQLQQRLLRSAKVQEGEQPAENPEALLSELDAAIAQLKTLIQQINQTNARTAFQNGTLSDALAEKETLQMQRNVYINLVDAASIRQERYTRSEVKFLSTVAIAQIQSQVDRFSRDYRELDSQIQALNWQTDLIEVGRET